MTDDRSKSISKVRQSQVLYQHREIQINAKPFCADAVAGIKIAKCTTVNCAH
jgi:hypothetical protein